VVAAAVLLMLAAAACGGGGLTLTEYAEQGESLLAKLASDLETLEAARETADPGIATERVYLDGRVVARVEFLDGLHALRDDEPPDDLVPVHEEAIDVVSRLLAAEQALASASYTVDDRDSVWASPEASHFFAVDAEAAAFCKARQADFDATQERERFENLDWMPAEAREVVDVLFGCE
jgi:hypothetical protein